MTTLVGLDLRTQQERPHPRAEAVVALCAAFEVTGYSSQLRTQIETSILPQSFQSPQHAFVIDYRAQTMTHFAIEKETVFGKVGSTRFWKWPKKGPSSMTSRPESTNE